MGGPGLSCPRGGRGKGSGRLHNHFISSPLPLLGVSTISCVSREVFSRYSLSLLSEYVCQVVMICVEFLLHHSFCVRVCCMNHYEIVLRAPEDVALILYHIV